MKDCNTRILLSAQTLASGNGGVCTVGRMTAQTLSEHYELRALACQDKRDHDIGPVPVRAFQDRRLPFVMANVVESLRATHVIYDHPGTARAHFQAPWAKRPYAIWLHGWEIWESPPQKYLRAIAGASLLIANSQYTLDRGRAAIPSGSNVRVCSLGTPESRSPARVGPGDGPPTVMLLGRADEMFAKGHDILIAVWPNVVSAVPDAKLLFVGGGSALGRVVSLADASPVRSSIEVTGFVPAEDIEKYWQRTTVFAMLGFAEGFGLVYIDAMRRGLPVIASADDGGQEVNVDGLTGFNVARADRARLTEVIVSLLRDRNLASSIGAAGHKQWQSQYSFEKFSRRLLGVTSDYLSC